MLEPPAPSGTPPSRLPKVVVLSAALLSLAAYGISQTGVSVPVIQFLDNFHWTLCYVVAAWLGWHGVKTAAPEEKSVRRWFAWGLLANAGGQIIWDIQVVTGWNPFPAPADMLYSALGPCCAVGLWQCLRANTSKPELRVATLDAAALGVGATAFVLTLYLPNQGEMGPVPLLLLVAYPVTLLGALWIGVVLALTLRLLPKMSWVLFLLALAGTGMVWMQWNILQLQEKLGDGTWLNLLFSLANLALGYGAMTWRVQGLTHPRMERLCEMALRILPLVLVMLAVISVVLAETFRQFSPAVQVSVDLASALAVVLIIWRQNVMVSERDHRLVVEQRMRESEGRYLSLFESSLDGIFILNGLKFVDCNERALQLLACSRDKIIGRSPLDISAERQPDGRQARDAMAERFSVEEKAPRCLFEWLVKRPDGSIFDAEISVNALHVGGRTIVQAVVRDISERKRAEEALRTSEARFSSSFESAAIGMALVGTDGHFLKVNAALSAMFGYTAEELMAKTFQEITHPDDLQADMSLLRKTLAGDRNSYQMEKRYIHKGGAVVSALLSVSLVRDGKGRPLHFTAQIQDVTQRKKLEEQFRQSQKMEAVGQLAGGVAHDFNNILTVIQGYASLLQSGNIAPADGVREISASVERAASLTRQLLTFSRKQIMQPRELDLNVVVQNMITLLRRTLGEHVTLQVEADTNLPGVMADQGMMEQIILNLAVNARDAMSRGGTLTVHTGSAVITEDEARQHADARVGLAALIKVTDTGCGIPVENLTRIFEPFFTTKEVNQGTGLGLATVHGIVRQHGGLVRVSSQLGVGTEFQILLPACRAAVKTPTHPMEAEPKAKGGHETILLVDDEPALRLVSKMTLKHFGYHVLEAGSGRQALKVVEDHPERIDLLLTDMVMPEGISGKDLADMLRDARPDIRVLFTSGYSVELLNRNIALSEDVWFLPKPFTTQKLAHMVRECLNAPVGGRDM